MKYIKKPIPVEAFQLPEGYLDDYTSLYPSWFLDARLEGIAIKVKQGYMIHTLEGEMLCPWGSYIIQGVNGELYPCRREVFEISYEKYEPNI